MYTESDSEELESYSDSSDFPTEDMEVPITVVQSKVDISPFIAVSTQLALVPYFGELQLEFTCYSRWPSLPSCNICKCLLHDELVDDVSLHTHIHT